MSRVACCAGILGCAILMPGRIHAGHIVMRFGQDGLLHRRARRTARQRGHRAVEQPGEKHRRDGEDTHAIKISRPGKETKRPMCEFQSFAALRNASLMRPASPCQSP